MNEECLIHPTKFAVYFNHLGGDDPTWTEEELAHHVFSNTTMPKCKCNPTLKDGKGKKALTGKSVGYVIHNKILGDT